jgi:hypothetical protein
MKTLHILRKRNDRLAEETIRLEGGSAKEGHLVTVLLIQDAVLGKPAVPAPIYVNIQDLQARGVFPTHGPTRAPTAGSDRGGSQKENVEDPVPHRSSQIIDYPQICQMILDHDRTVVW